MLTSPKFCEAPWDLGDSAIFPLPGAKPSASASRTLEICLESACTFEEEEEEEEEEVVVVVVVVVAAAAAAAAFKY